MVSEASVLEITQATELRKAKRLLAVAIDQKGEDTISYLAQHAGLTEGEVEDLLQSDVYRELLRREAWRLMTHAMLRGLKAMEVIARNRKEKASNRVAAHRAIVHTCQVATQGKSPPPEDADPEKALTGWAAKHGTPPPTPNGSTRRTRSHPQAKEDRRKGSHPAA